MLGGTLGGDDVGGESSDRWAGGTGIRVCGAGVVASGRAAGCRVRVPLGTRRATGTVTGLSSCSDAEARGIVLKPLAALIEGQPVIPPKLLELAHWIADYYCAPLEQVMRSVLPMSVRSERTGFRSQKVVRLVRALEANERAALERTSPAQAAIVARLEASGGPILLAALSAASVKSLAQKAIVAIEPAIMARDPHAAETFLPSAPLELNGPQAACLSAVTGAIDDPTKARPMLLFGVTGSGKTEVYLQGGAARARPGIERARAGSRDFADASDGRALPQPVRGDPAPGCRAAQPSERRRTP